MKRLLVTTFVTGLIALTALTATALGAGSHAYYVSLGDSLAAGQQPIGNFERGYANQLFRSVRKEIPNLQLVKLGCGGEMTRTFIRGIFFCPFPAGSQLAQAVDAALVATYDANGVPVADIPGAFAISNFTDFVRLRPFGLVPVNVANACTWTWYCTPPPLGPDPHATTEGYGVIARAFADVVIP